MHSSLVGGGDITGHVQFSAENLSGAVFERTQALYMLSLFLSGNTRARAQAELTRLSFARRICGVYDSFRWNRRRVRGSPDQVCDLALHCRFITGLKVFLGSKVLCALF